MKNLYKPSACCLFLCFMLNLFHMVPGRAQQKKVSPAVAANLQTTLNNMRNAYNVKGITAAVYSPKHGSWKGVTGVSHGTVPIDTTMLFGAGSVTKTFVAAEIFKLVDAGLLQLSDSLHSLIGSYQHVNQNITVRQLLGHKSGLGDVTNQAWQNAMFANLHRVWYIPEVLNSFLTPPVAAPGGPWNYCNANYLLLAEIIEAKKSDSLHKILRTDLLQPNGLANTYMEVFEKYTNPTPHNWSTPNMNPAQATDQGTTPRTALWSSAEADGGYFTDAADLAKWAFNLYTGQVISPASVSEMLNFTTVNGGYFSGYGLGAMRFNSGARTFWGHAGNYFGYAATMLYYPQDSIAVGLLVNQDCISPNIARTMMNVMVQNITGTNEAFAKPVYSIFPNPADASIQVAFPDGNSAGTLLELTDITGKKIYEGIAPETGTEIQTAGLPQGIYFLKLSTEKGSITEKIVIQH